MEQSQPAGEGEWTEHLTKEGKKYYFNRRTNTSSWVRPEQQPRGEISKDLQDNSCPWKEYTTPNGKKYYHNRITNRSEWNIPEEYRLWLDKQNPQTNYSPPKTFTPSIKNTVLTPKPTIKPVTYATKEEAKAAFIELLTEKNISTDLSWEATMQRIIDDPRYKALNSLSERKETFFEYVEKQKKEEERIQKEIAKKLKEDFIKLLKEHKEIDGKSNYKKISKLIENDDRYKNIQHDEEKEYYYEQYLWESENDRKEKEKSSKEENKQALLILLNNYNSSKDPNLLWKKIKEKFKDELCFLSTEPLERLKILQDYISVLERSETDQLRKEKESRRRQQRKCREKFTDMLILRYNNNEFNFRMSWPEVVHLLKEEDSYKAMLQIEGSTPGELFGDFVEDLEDKYEIMKSKSRRALKNKNFVVRPNVSFGVLINAIEDAERFSDDFKKQFYEDEISFAEEQQKEKLKQKKKSKKFFLDLLYSYIKKDTSWDSVRDELALHSIFNEIENEEERIQLFQDHLQYLAEGTNTEDDKRRQKYSKSSRKHSEKKHNSRRHKRHRRSHDSSSSESPKRKKKKTHDHSRNKRDTEVHSREEKSEELEMGEIVEN